MRRLRLTIAAVTLGVMTFAGSGVASAGVEWCDWGCPPPVESGKVASKTSMPTPLFKNSNGKFVDTGKQTALENTIYLPPGYDK